MEGGVSTTGLWGSPDIILFFKNNLIYDHAEFVAAHGLSLVVVIGATSQFQYAGFSLWWLLIAEHGL